MKQIFYFTAEWCGPCKTLGPIMDKVSEVIPVEKINIEYETDRTKAAKVINIPTVVLAEKGEEIRRFVGIMSYEQIMQFING
jgi:thioredoxin-like negative regulator of GroEL